VLAVVICRLPGEPLRFGIPYVKDVAGGMSRTWRAAPGPHERADP
jgi:hypothetical protein